MLLLLTLLLGKIKDHLSNRYNNDVATKDIK